MLSVRADTFGAVSHLQQRQSKSMALQPVVFRSKLVPFAEALLIASKETGLEANAEKTKYMVMSRDENAGQTGTYR